MMVAGKVDIYSAKAKKVNSIQMPQYSSSTKDSALMWYFISWSQKLKNWPAAKKMKYAREIGKISSTIPLHMVDFNIDIDKLEPLMKDLKLFGYKNNKFVMFDEQGKVVSEMSGIRLYALFAYLIDSLSKGLQDQDGFDFVKMAKKLMKAENEKKKKK